MSDLIKIAVDAMGGDGSPKKIIDGIIHHYKNNNNTFYKIFGDKDIIDEILGNNLNKKAVLFSVAGFNEHRLSSDKSITILINSKKVCDSLSPKIVKWNEERQQENQENALSSYSICTREERKSDILNFRRNRLLMVDISILTQRKVASITAQIPRLWANDTRLSPQVSLSLIHI